MGLLFYELGRYILHVELICTRYLTWAINGMSAINKALFLSGVMYDIYQMPDLQIYNFLFFIVFYKPYNSGVPP